MNFCLSSINLILLENTPPGQGGQPYNSYGGGGGGVLVGGNGPYRSGYQGAGYGGGGSGRAYWTSSGADGVILVEVI